MTSNQFFVPRLEGGTARIVIQGDEHRHLAGAARVRAGDEVRLFDAEGNRCSAEVVAVGRDRTVLRVLRREAAEGLQVELLLVQALLPAKKMEFLLQKSAELGCAGFVPVTTERSLKDPPERSGRKLERWARIAREATKQSKGGRSTAVRAPVTLKTLLREAPEGRKLFLSERGGRPLKDVLSAQGPGGGAAPLSVSLVVGPEGGWTLNEESLLREAGFEAVGLGHRILKAETAALAASAMILHYWNE